MDINVFGKFAPVNALAYNYTSSELLHIAWRFSPLSAGLTATSTRLRKPFPPPRLQRSHPNTAFVLHLNFLFNTSIHDQNVHQYPTSRGLPHISICGQTLRVQSSQVVLTKREDTHQGRQMFCTHINKKRHTNQECQKNTWTNSSQQKQTETIKQ